MQVILPKLHRGGDTGDNAAFPLRGLRFIDRAEQQHGEDRADGAKTHKTEAVRLGVFIASNGRNADTERHDERYGHRSRRHAAGVERDGENARLRQKCCGKDDGIEYDEHCAQGNGKQDTHHAQHQEKADADRNRQDQNLGVDLRHVACEHLKVRLGHRDGNAEGEADDQDKSQLARFCHFRAHVVTDAAHRHVSAQCEQSHAEDQHGCCQNEREHQSRVDRHEHKADCHDDQADGQDGSGGFFQFFK